MDYSELTQKLISGNTRAAARLITFVENDDFGIIGFF